MFPKDVKALIYTATDFDYDLRVLKAVEAVNDDQKSHSLQEGHEVLRGNIKARPLHCGIVVQATNG